MIEICNITKKFDDFTAIEDLSFTVGDSSVHGLVGYNGAGKTTLLKIIAGIYRQDNGTVRIDGTDVFKNPHIKEEMFYVPDDLYFSIGSNMESMAKFYKSYYPKFCMDTFHNLANLFGLDTKKRLFGFSKGMQRQAEMVLALASMPKVILLDECFDGLDPAKRNMTRKLLLDYMAEKNCSVIISSHNLHELADMCDHIALINGKKIAMNCSVDDMNGTRCKFRLIFADDRDREHFNAIDNLKNFKKDGKIISFTVSDKVEQAREIIHAMNPLLVEEFPLTLEEIFLDEMEDTDYDFEKIFS
ncbi:MAG: ABC transporter ATP-binding protein [Clostridia bacterium]|nr:ABC transporter ATP-binding protein [Clostridia bacterium]